MCFFVKEEKTGQYRPYTPIIIKMTKLESITYKAENEIVSPSEWNEELQKWDYIHIPEKDRLAGEAQGLRISRELMAKLYKMFPDRDDERSNKPIYTHREMNKTIRAAIAQNYRKL